MKKKLFFCFSALLCLWTALTGCAPQAGRPAFAESSDNNIAAVSSSTAEEQSDRVAVIGSASVTLVPDMAELTFDVTTDGDTAADVTAQNEKAANKMTEDLISSGIKKEDILAIFQKEAKDIRVGDMHNGEFDFWVRFPEENEDEYYYCFKDEGCHMIYHRFLPEDYADFEF